MQKSAELGQNQPENPKLIDGGFKFLLQGPSKSIQGGVPEKLEVGKPQVGSCGALPSGKGVPSRGAYEPLPP
jgi:hypothetical protein